MVFVCGRWKVGLVAAGDHHCAAVTGADIGEGHQNIDLAAHEVAVVKSELISFRDVMSARVDPDCLAGAAQVGKVFVNEERPVVKVERAFPAHKVLDFFEPGRMVNQVLESGAGFVDLLQVQAVGTAVLVAVDVTGPLSYFQGQDGIDFGIAGGDLFSLKGVIDQQISSQIKEKDFVVRRSSLLLLSVSAILAESLGKLQCSAHCPTTGFHDLT